MMNTDQRTNSDVCMSADTNSYVGNTAQPFLNELEVAITTNGQTGNSTTAAATIQHWSLELMNPFASSGPLNLAGWQVVLYDSTGATVEATASLTSLTSGSGGATPAGYI